MNEKFIFEPFSIGNVRFRNPFFVASGPTTRNIDQLKRAEECGWGGASLKLAIAPSPYINREPRYGWFADQGVFSFTTEKRLTPDQCLRLLEQARVQTSELVIMANITYAGEAHIKQGWGEFARQCQDAGAHIIELNMCCPNMSFNVELSSKGQTSGPKTGASLGQDAQAVSAITRAVVESVSIPVFVKLTPEGGRIADVARACFEAGADAVGGTGNRLAIPPFDIYNPGTSPYALQKELSLSCFAGGWIKPLALRDVFEMRKLVGPGPVITAAGGIRNFHDVVEMTFMGANLYGICAETILSGFGFLEKIIDDLRVYLDEMGYASLDDFRGTIVNELKSAKTVTLSKGYAQIKDRSLSAPCVVACPAYVPAQGYVMAVAKKDFRKAFDLITAASPLQSVCGYACNHPCESECIRGDVDEPVRIREIKRFVLEYAKSQGWQPDVKIVPSKHKKAAIIGAGPAGLSAAYYLRLAGFKVTVFEKEEQAGGLLRYGIPRYRLPADILDFEIESLRQMGVDIKTSQALGKDFTLASLREDGYDAVLLAFGAQKSLSLGVANEKAGGYLSALEFLNDFHHGDAPHIGDRVVVIGGGFSAVDAARTCVRLGAKEVFIAYRRTRDEMPASAEEIAEAEEEGVKIMYLASPKEIVVEDGNIRAIRLVNHVLGEKDPGNRRKPLEVEGTEFLLPVDTVISALGQKADNPGDAEVARIMENGVIRADKVTFATELENVYAIGDAALGAGDIISAIASGKRAAVAVDQALGNGAAALKPVVEQRAIDRHYVLERKGAVKRAAAVENAVAAAEQRVGNFDLYSRPFTEEEAVREAGRCMNCGCGEGCMLCVELCNSFAIDNVRGKPLVREEDCVGCGICVLRCPTENLEMLTAAN